MERALVKRVVDPAPTHWLDESAPTSPNAVTASATAAEAEAQRLASLGGTAVILRFGSFYGPDSEHTRDAVKFARRGLGTAPGPRDGFIASVSTDDAAAAVLAAVTEAESGTYNVVDEEPAQGFRRDPRRGRASPSR